MAKFNDEPRNAKYFTELAYKKRGRQRFTQDSPILSDVLVHYGLQANKSEAMDLLLTPDWSKTPREVAEELKLWLRAGSETPDTDQAHEKTQIAFNQSVVAVKLTFEDLLCSVLPMSWWWQNRLTAIDGLDPVHASTDPKLAPQVRQELLMGLESDHELNPPNTRHRLIRQDFIWAARLFWVVQHSNRKKPKDGREDDFEGIADYFLGNLMQRIAECQKKPIKADLDNDQEQEAKPRKPPSSPWVYSINRNRPIESAMHHSLVTTKADAAIRTFDVRGQGIRWAIIDSGIDARHAAFRKMQADGLPYERAFDEQGNHTRIKATYDFSNIRAQLSQDQRRALDNGRMIDWEALEQRLEKNPKQKPLRIRHNDHDYRTPKLAHGTHVAGILGADWRPDPEAIDPLGPQPTEREPTQPFQGMCPEIELYDLRVFKAGGGGDEFAVMSALQFVRSLNQRYDTLEVHGVNLSLAMEHEVSNYACGRSPVCEECTRLVGNGVLVVAAAGNQGRSIYTTVQQQRQEGYRTVSIADPGNTEAVITVGSTHRREPHTYGVSYFSSRGPTGDGRTKPDLVAPGEKIVSTTPGDRKQRQDGTSQAAPHVSGAAALLMSRHREVIGQPARVKQVLMETATDLGRERHFQGAGLVDVMRALQKL